MKAMMEFNVCYISSLFLALSSGMFFHVTSNGGERGKGEEVEEIFPPLLP